MNYLISLMIFLSVPLFARTKVQIGVLDTGPGSNHEQKVLEVLKLHIKKCPLVKIKTYPIYDLKGNLTESLFTKALKNAISESDLLNLSWNIESTEQTKNIEKELIRSAKEKVLIAAAGAPDSGSPSQKIEKTVLGKVSDAFIVAEKTKEHQSINSYYGPEVFISIPPPPGYTGSSFSTPILTAKIACELNHFILNNHSDKSALSDHLTKLKLKFRTKRAKEAMPLSNVDLLFK